MNDQLRSRARLYARAGLILFLSSVFLTGALFTCPVAVAQGDKVFSIPVSDLKNWSDQVVVTLDQVKIKGHSGVHKVNDDCEMHLGAGSVKFEGDPPGLVLEPMNLCVEPFFKKTSQKDQDWTTFGDQLVGKTVRIEGVPRIWPEHLLGKQSASNPNHAVEFHPLTKLVDGAKSYDFSQFIYAPDNYQGGVKDASANAILKGIVVGVTVENDNADIDVDVGTIGNFTVLHARLFKDKTSSVVGGHRMEGEVKADQTMSVHMVSVKGSDIDDKIEKFSTGKRKTMSFDALVLFSLSPAELLSAALKSKDSGQREVVNNPIQLIIYGVPEPE